MKLFWVLLPLLLLRNVAAEVCSNQPADIGFLIDESGSVGATNFKKNLDFVKQFVDLFDIGNSSVKISAFAFHRLIGKGFHFSCCNDKASIKSNVDMISYHSGGEDFEMALNFSKNSMFQSVNGARDFSLKILMFFTDGQSSVQDGGSLLHQLGIIVYAVGVGNGVNRNQLDKIATNQSYVFMVSSYYDLVGQVYDDIKSKTCTDVLTNPCQRSPQPCQNQGTCIWTGGSKYTCLCPDSFTGHNCQIGECSTGTLTTSTNSSVLTTGFTTSTSVLSSTSTQLQNSKECCFIVYILPYAKWVCMVIYVMLTLVCMVIIIIITYLCYRRRQNTTNGDNSGSELSPNRKGKSDTLSISNLNSIPLLCRPDVRHEGHQHEVKD